MRKLNKTAYETLKLLDNSYNVTIDTVKLNIHNTLEHELSKFFLVWEALKNGNSIVTEGIFKNGKRCDILNLDSNEAVEVVTSETIISMKAKLKEYPTQKTMFIKSEDVLKYWLRRVQK